jgi:hypothetical protein
MSEQSEANASAPDERGRIRKFIGNLPSGEAPVGWVGVTLAAVFLTILTVSLLVRITQKWPVCDLDVTNTNVNGNANNNNAGGNGNANTGASSTANANSSAALANANTANAAANANTTANTAANANSSGNTNAGRATNTNPAAPARSPSAATNQPSVANANTIQSTSPKIEPTSGPITGKTMVTIKGKNFGEAKENLEVKFGESNSNVADVKDDTIRVSTPRHSEGVVDVTITKKDKENKDVYSYVLPSAYTYTCPAPTGSTLFYMLIMAGMLGGCIHALRSLYWYYGQGELLWRWMLMYFLLPFIGAAMATIFSLLIIAGFVDNSTGRSTALFIIAAAGLVGMFSQQAALKLTDIANAFFTKPGPGENAKPQASLPVSGTEKSVPITATGMDKNEGKEAGGDEVTITGSGFNTDVTMVTFGGKAAPSLKIQGPTSLLVKTPPGTGTVDVIVHSKDQTAPLPTKFKYNP